MVDPGFEVDLYVSTDLRTLTALWLGHVGWAQASGSGAIRLTGTQERQSALRRWLGTSAFAAVPRAVG